MSDDLMNEIIEPDEVVIIDETYEPDLMDIELDELTESPTVLTSDEKKMVFKIDINPDKHRIGNPYFKLYNDIDYSKATKIARLHFLDKNREYHKDHFKEWILSKSEINTVRKVLKKPNKKYDKYTNWKVLCWTWNLYYFSEFNISMMDEYMKGELDEKYKDHSFYVPSTTPIPETWVYKPPKK